jgi:hypothetical protein
VQDVANNRFLSTYQNQNKTLVAGDIVQNKRAIERLTLQLLDDVEIEARTALSIDAGAAVIVESGGDFHLDHIKADGDVRIKAAMGIYDLGLGEAAISSFGDLVLLAGTSIEASSAPNNTAALRIQLSPTSWLSADVAQDLRLKQVAADLSVPDDFDKGVTRTTAMAVNDLIAYRLNAGAALEVEVEEGDLYLGRITSDGYVKLQAQSDILDFFDDSDSPVVNIFTGNVADPATGDVTLLTTTGHVGRADNYIDVRILKGSLNGTVARDSFINSVTDLNVGSYTSVDGNVTMIVDGQANIGLITALGDEQPDPATSLGDGLVTITARTFIVDRRNDAGANIWATGALLIADKGIGSANNPFDTRISAPGGRDPGRRHLAGQHRRPADRQHQRQGRHQGQEHGRHLGLQQPDRQRGDRQRCRPGQAGRVGRHHRQRRRHQWRRHGDAAGRRQHRLHGSSASSTPRPAKTAR